MKIAVMQPYLFPYIGYWQLINAVDEFVILDDVNYIVRGYINRNYILLNGSKYRFTVPIKNASQNRLIMDTKINADIEWKKNFLLTISNAYRKSPKYKVVLPIIEEIINNIDDDLTDYIKYSIQKITCYLGIKTNIIKSSEIKKQTSVKGEKRIIDICKKRNADVYINPSGGRSLYSQSDFQTENVQLKFLDPLVNEIVYKQDAKVFIPSLSIIDVMMNVSVDDITQMLEKYKLSNE